MKSKGCFSTLLGLLEYFFTYDGKEVKWSDHCGFVAKEKDNILICDLTKSLCFILKENSFILKIINEDTDNKYYFEGTIDEFYSRVCSNNTKRRIEFLINTAKMETLCG